MRTIYRIIIISISLISFAARADKEEKERSFQTKKGNAVKAFSEEDGFKLSEKALKNLDVNFKTLKGNGPWSIPKSAIVRIKHSTGVYRQWNHWITMVLVKILNESEDSFTIKSIDLQNQDQIAVTGVKFLRMTEADLKSDTVDSCSH